MGGFASGLGDAIGDALGKYAAPVMDAVGSKISAAGEAIGHLTSVESVMNKYPESAALADDFHKLFLPAKNTSIAEAATKEHELHMPEVKERVDITQHPDYDPAVHKTTGRLHPVTGKILSDAPINQGAILDEGTRAGRLAWLGKGDISGVTAAHLIEERHGLAAARAFSDSVAFLLKDNVPVKGMSPISTFKNRLIKSGVNLGRSGAKPSYEPSSSIERAVTRTAYAAFSPLLIIPHISTFFNGFFGSDAKTFLGSAVRSVSAGIGKNSDHWQSLVDTGAMTDSLMREIGNYNRFTSEGRTFKNLPPDSIINKVYKLSTQPFGFSYLRDMQLVHGGLTGQATAEQLGKDYARNPGNKRLVLALKAMNLDPVKVLAQKGNLDTEDINKAVFQFVDKHYYVDNTIQRSILTQASPTFRILSMYHSYVTRQAKMMANAVALDYKTNGLAGTAKNLAIATMLLPMVGEGIKMLRMTTRGQDAEGTAQKDYENITGENGIPAALQTYFEALGYNGSFGVYSDMLRGALHNEIAAALGGPIVRASTDLAHDTIQGVSKSVTSAENDDPVSAYQSNFTPLERDLSYDIPGISLLANLFDHRVLPKKNENPDNDPVKKAYNDLTQ